MSAFSAEWLDIREPVDARSRSAKLAALIDPASAVDCRGADAVPLRVLDLAAGTGSHLRWLGPILRRPSHWVAVDHDTALLRALRSRERADAAGTRIETRCIDLSKRLASLDFNAFDLVAASALLDLVSAEWLQQLAAKCARAGIAAYFSLTYDGRMIFEPADEADEQIRAAINWHQLGDKGFGPALGPDAASRAVGLFEHFGYAAHCEPSDWRLMPADAALQAALLAGWRDAVRETGLVAPRRIDRWHELRAGQLREGRLQTTVGHVDLLFEPRAEGSGRAIPAEIAIE